MEARTENRAPANVGDLLTPLANNNPATAAPAPVARKAAQSVSAILNSVLDSDGYRKRLNDILGERTPQFVSAVISLVNADKNLRDAALSSPQTIVQAALKAATYDLPVDNGLGFAYIVPFKNKGVPEAQFIMGYKGMVQLAFRTGCYQNINCIDIREGEIVKQDRLREDFEFNWIEDETEREKARVVGYAAFFRLVNGAEKILYMTVDQIKAHEVKNRKGQYMSKGWRDDFDSMARKTVIRRLLGRWGVMSIDYKTASPAAIKASEAVNAGFVDDDMIDADAVEANVE